MRCGENVTASAVNEEGNAEDGGQADDIERAETLSSASQNLSARKRRYRLFLKVLQKINMCFLVIFIGYFAWTISVNFGHSGITNDVAWNNSGTQNVSMQAENSRNHSGSSRSIPFHSAADDNHSDQSYQPNIVMPAHRKQTKKRRKKGRNRKRKQRKHRKTTYSSLEDYLNLTVEHRKNRNAKVTCSDCKIRKRKGRREKLYAGKISPSVLRKVLEKVADDTLSGARTGTGTIQSLFEDELVRKNYGRDEEETGWSYDQHWVSIASGDTINSDETIYRTDDSSPDKEDTTPWTSWSPCSVSCGAGQRERMRRCGTACTEVESMVCVNPQCEGASVEDSSSTISEFYKWEQDGFVPPVNLPQQEYLDSNEDVCGKWVKCNQKFAQDFINNSSLPACPCFFPLIRVKSKDIFDVRLDKDVKWVDASSHSDLVYKPGAFACMRSSLTPGTTTLAVQQCCYDGLYSLVTRGKSAGTPVLISPEISKELHYKVDLLPWIICKGDWTRYNKVLTPDNTLSCRQNPDDETIKWQKQQARNY